jgi:hypothetical protein
MPQLDGEGRPVLLVFLPARFSKVCSDWGRAVKACLRVLT